jgi:hypothetical protein
MASHSRTYPLLTDTYDYPSSSPPPTCQIRPQSPPSSPPPSLIHMRPPSRSYSPPPPPPPSYPPQSALDNRPPPPPPPSSPPLNVTDASARPAPPLPPAPAPFTPVPLSNHPPPPPLPPPSPSFALSQHITTIPLPLPPASQTPPPWPNPADLAFTILKNACSGGDIKEVKMAIPRVLGVKSEQQLDIACFHGAIVRATLAGHIHIVEHFLRSGLFKSSELPVYGAIRAKSYTVLQLFLDYGWDINKPCDDTTPPYLA